MANYHALHVGGPFQPSDGCYKDSMYPRKSPRPDYDVHPSGCQSGALNSVSWALSPLKPSLYNYFVKKIAVDDFVGCNPISIHRWLTTMSVHINRPIAGLEIQLAKIPLLVAPDEETFDCGAQNGFACEPTNWAGIPDISNAELIGDPIIFADAVTELENQISHERDPTKFAIGVAPDAVEMNPKTWMLGFKILALPEDGLCSKCAQLNLGFAVHATFIDDCYRLALTDSSDVVGWEICPPH